MCIPRRCALILLRTKSLHFASCILFLVTPSCRLADFVLPEALRVRGYDVGPDEEEDVEAQFSDDEAVRVCTASQRAFGAVVPSVGLSWAR